MRTTNTSTHLPIPAQLRPLAEALVAHGALLDRARLAEFLTQPQASIDFISADKAIRLLDRADNHGAVRYTELKLSARTHRIVEPGGQLARLVFPGMDPFKPRDGYAFVTIDIGAVPFHALAHLSGDARLEASLASEDPYGYLADRIPGYGGHRTMIKLVLFREFFGTGAPTPGAQPRQLSGELRKLLPDAYGYRDECMAAVGNLDHVEQLTAQAANGALVHVFAHLARYIRPVYLDRGNDLLCEVEPSNLEHVVTVLDKIGSVTTNQINLPVSYQVHAPA